MELKDKYLPSEPCSCEVCRSYCRRPGWWTVEEAEKVIETSFAGRMMLEISPEHNFGVLSPAFRGNETNYALQLFSQNGCTFFSDGLCELFGTGLQPLECRFCHHDRVGEGIKCHSGIEQEWNTPRGKRVIVRWGNLTGFWEKQGLKMVEK
ncbi:MAG TPA: hypothetical protein PLW67_14100 [Prolixibacteraceae bacterium]|nr:hypothetical protein [Prolixibacteraceae bacterium]